MTLLEYARYCAMRSNQAMWMNGAIRNHEEGNDRQVIYDLLNWAEHKHIADEINHNNDNMAFARAIGMAYGIERAFK